MQIQLLSVFLILSIGCNDSYEGKKSKTGVLNGRTNEIEISISDTISPLDYISLKEQEKRDSLEKYDRTKYAQIMLKKFAYCNCLFQAFRSDSVFTSIDQSNGLLALSLVIHTRNVVDSIKKEVGKYVAWVNRTDGVLPDVKNYSLFCLTLYESQYLDSLVKKFDNDIKKK